MGTTVDTALCLRDNYLLPGGFTMFCNELYLSNFHFIHFNFKKSVQCLRFKLSYKNTFKIDVNRINSKQIWSNGIPENFNWITKAHLSVVLSQFNFIIGMSCTRPVLSQWIYNELNLSFCSQLFYVALLWFGLTGSLADPSRKVCSWTRQDICINTNVENNKICMVQISVHFPKNKRWKFRSPEHEEEKL